MKEVSFFFSSCGLSPLPYSSPTAHFQPLLSVLFIYFFNPTFAASLSDGTDVVHGPNFMRWSMTGRHLLHQVAYNNDTGSLVIQKEGFYQVYSKISFKATHVFHHSVEQTTSRYKGKDIPILTTRKYSPTVHQGASFNSYLGGVFHLQVNDTIFVKVRDTSKLERYEAQEHVFGAYML